MGSLFPDLAGAEQRKTAGAFLRLLSLCWRRAIFPGRRQPSIVATDELNFRVRNGNGWTLIVISTDWPFQRKGNKAVAAALFPALRSAIILAHAPPFVKSEFRICGKKVVTRAGIEPTFGA